MRVLLGDEEIQRWAEFSGDYNPIHFKREAARALGVDDVVVHGMLALMKVLSLCSTRPELSLVAADCAGSSDRPDIRLHSMFRRPILRNYGHEIELQHRHAMTRYTLTGLANTEPALAGSCSRVAPARGLGGPAAYSHTWNAQNLKESYALFRRCIPHARHAWLYLSALSFAQLLQSDLPRRALAVQLSADHPIFHSGMLLVQSYQDIQYGGAFLNRVLDHPEEAGEITANYALPTLVQGSPTEIVGSFEYEIHSTTFGSVKLETGLIAREVAPSDPTQRILQLA